MTGYYVFLFYVLFVSFGALMLLAAISDGSRFIIPNAVVVSVAALFIVAAVLLPYETPWLSHIGAAMAVFVVGMAAYRFRVLGAGDIKLISAVSLWAGFEQLPVFLLSIGVVGGALTILLLTLRCLFIRFPIPASGAKLALPRIFVWGEPIPYGVAIAISAIILATQSPYLLALV